MQSGRNAARARTRAYYYQPLSRPSIRLIDGSFKRSRGKVAVKDLKLLLLLYTAVPHMIPSPDPPTAVIVDLASDVLL